MTAEEEAIHIIRQYMKSSDDCALLNLLKQNELLVMTDDGSFTLRSTSEKELMHSRIGALREAKEKFVIPSQITDMASPAILDLCSGLGYNTIAALDANPQSKITMVELVPEMLFLGKCLPIPSISKHIFDQAVEQYFNNVRDTSLQIFCNDARIVLSDEFSETQFDVVFHDGFSPGNDPVLYTVDFLSLVKRHMKKTGLLISYSSSIPFRSALISAGFFIEEGPSIGRKRGITLASPSHSSLKFSGRIPRQDEQLIALTSTGLPFRDECLQFSGKKIIENRDKARLMARESSKFLSSKQIKKGKLDQQYVRIQEKATNSNEAVEEMNKFLLTRF